MTSREESPSYQTFKNRSEEFEHSDKNQVHEFVLSSFDTRLNASRKIHENIGHWQKIDNHHCPSHPSERFYHQSEDNFNPVTSYYVTSPTPPMDNYRYGMATMSSPSSGYPFYQSPVIKLVVDIKPGDVLSGRGGATNSHSGNRAFRTLVKRYQDQYLKAKKRDKPAVASIIVEKIRQKRGRFLRRVNRTTCGEILWTDIGDDRAREKTCQALREGAPEIRKKRKQFSADKSLKDEVDADVTSSASSSPSRTTSAVEHNSVPQNIYDNSPIGFRLADERNEVESDQHDPLEEKSIIIRPSTAITKVSYSEMMSVDQLSPQDRDIYLRDFLPPDSSIPRRRNEEDDIPSSQAYAH